MGTSDDVKDLESLLADLHAAAEQCGGDPADRQRIVASLTKISKGVRAIIRQRDELLSQCEQLSAERNRLAGRLTRGGTGGVETHVREDWPILRG